jgi:hypothetical protein
MNFVSLIFVMFLCIANMHAQFPDRVGTPDCDAIPADQPGLNWGVSCMIAPGYISIAESSNGKVSVEDATFAIGPADNAVISLGDGGIATMTFQYPITDGPGADFAVFENAFDDYFLEFAFVEVSSDGVHFVRFPSVSLTQTMQQIGPFMRIPDVRAIHNLAGKYRGGYGTPFDLASLKDSVGLDIQAVTHVRVIDVIGAIEPRFASRDSKGNIINDPWPTPFSSCGFDLDGIAVIHEQRIISEQMNIAPNPIHAGENGGTVRVMDAAYDVSVFSMQGEFIREGKEGIIQTNGLPGGVYVVRGIIDGHLRSGMFMILP